MQKNIWFKSSYSTGNGGACVEVKLIDDAVLVHHSKDQNGPEIIYTIDEWRAFVAGVLNHEFDI